MIAAVLALGACGGGDEGVGGVTAEESRQLNEAAAMLDEATDSLGETNEADPGDGEEAGAEAPAEELGGNAK
jgi:hypothetical protein